MSISNYGSLHVVNTSTLGNQFQATAAGLADGDIIVTWFDSNLEGIRAQYYDAWGNAIGSEFSPTINYPGNYDTEQPRVVADPYNPFNKGFLIAAVDVSYGFGSPNNRVTADLFDTSGNHTSALDYGISGSDYTYAVAKPFGNGTVFAFEDAATNHIEYTSTGVHHTANTFALGPQTMPDLAVLADGSHYVISWWDEMSQLVKFRLFDSQDAPVTAEGAAGFVGTASGSPAYGYRGDAVAALTGGNFVIVWNSQGVSNVDQDRCGIMGSVFDSSGHTTHFQFQVNTTKTLDQLFPSVVGLLDGGFAVAWTDFSTGSSRTVMRTFDASGNPTSDEFVVDGAGHHDYAPQLTLLSDGRIAVSWEADQGVQQDNAGWHSEMQIVDPRTAGMTFVANPAVADLVGTLFNDTFIAEIGNDRFASNGGVDTVSYRDSDVGVDVNLATANAQAVSSVMTDSLNGISAVIGSAWDDLLAAGVGNSSLFGSAGNDVLTGRSGRDTLDGGADNDTLRGNGGIDHFVFDTSLKAAGVDRVVDFHHGVDQIELSHAVFTALNAAGVLHAAMFQEGVAAQTANEHIVYNPGNGWLIYDSNGSAAGGGHHFATLAPHLTLTNTDFMVVA